MKQNKLKITLITALIGGSMVITSSGTALAKANSLNFNKAVLVEDCERGICTHRSIEDVKAQFDNLVKSKIITEEQKNKIITFMEQKREEHMAEKKKIDSMTEEERHNYFSKKPREKHDLFKELVENKIVDEKQAEAIKNAIFKSHDSYAPSNQNNTDNEKSNNKSEEDSENND